jgi:hypothetical protein
MLVSSSFSETFSAVYGSSSAGFEWNFAFFAALCTGCFVHFSAFSIRQAYTSNLLEKKSSSGTILTETEL